MDLYWEQIKTFHNEKQARDGTQEWRARVPGGWLIKTLNSMTSAGGITFYPDPKHEWNENSQSLLRPTAQE